MPRPTETATSKLLKLLDELTPDEIRFAKEILNHREREDRANNDPPKRRGRRKASAPVENAE